MELNISLHMNFNLESCVLLCQQIQSHKCSIMAELEQMLEHHAPLPTDSSSSLFELPHLAVDGIPTQLDKMTQVSNRHYNDTF